MIGAGIIGAVTALSLRRSGVPVVLIDAGEPGRGASYGNGGAISPDMCVPMALPGMLRRVPRWLFDPTGPLVVRWSHLPAVLPWLARWIRAGRLERVRAISSALHALHSGSLDRYGELLGNRGGALLEKTGQLYVWRGRRASPTEALARRLREEKGIETRSLASREIKDIDPNLADDFTEGLFFPDNGHTVDPLRLVETLVELFVDAGGTLLRRKALGFELGDAALRAVRTDRGDLPASAAVLCAGFAARRLAATLGDRVPLAAERGYHVMLPDPGVRPSIKISNRDEMFGMTPMADGVRIAGTVEFARADAPMDERRPRAMLAHAQRMYPGLKGEGASFWVGSRPSTPDSLPVIDRSRRAANLIYAFGHGHTGLSGAPATGALVRAFLSDRPPAIDPAPYRLDRF